MKNYDHLVVFIENILHRKKTLHLSKKFGHTFEMVIFCTLNLRGRIFRLLCEGNTLAFKGRIVRFLCEGNTLTFRGRIVRFLCGQGTNGVL